MCAYLNLNPVFLKFQQSKCAHITIEWYIGEKILLYDIDSGLLKTEHKVLSSVIKENLPRKATI